MHPLGQLMLSYAIQHNLEQLDGVVDTAIKSVKFYRTGQSSQRQLLLYQSGIIIMGHGDKRVHLNERAFSYGPGDYLVLGVPLPLECEAFSRDDQPIYGIAIDVDPHTLLQLVNQLEKHHANTTASVAPECGLVAERMDQAMLQTCERLLQSLLNHAEAEILGEHLVTELIYRILTGPRGNVLFNLAKQDGHYARVAKALTLVHQDYSQPLTVDNLAASASMSISAFHRAFRQVTLESPLQYLKKVRLNKAKELITLEGKRVNDAAHLVGYSSPSQFSREFKRHFQTTPKKITV
ncbi:AraC family transcriptional regulator [Motilimonas cestriensis]|uniref:AraC family transcriptional regulator n=1 Tax=Motilimonas cestriensis TaxID=2742685 RepID=UPI003DA65C0F